MEPVKISELAAEITAEARMLVDPAGLRLELELEPDIAGDSVAVDSARIRHVFINLLTNAVKFSPSGGTVTLGGGDCAAGFREILGA